MFFKPWVCTGPDQHRLEVDNVSSEGKCRLCKSDVYCKTTPAEVRRAMELDRFRPVKTVLIKGRKHRVQEKECLWCNTVYETAYVNSRYCSTDCKAAQARTRDRRRRHGVITCLFCGTETVTTDRRRKFCKTECREKMRKA